MKNHILITIFFTTFFFVSLVLFLKVFFLGYYPDFSGYYYGSKAMLAGRNPYLGGQGFFTPYVYPPFVLLLFAPFVIFPYSFAEIVWTFLSFVFLISSLYFIYRMYDESILNVSNLFLFGLVLFSFPVKYTFGMGQINCLVLLLITLGIFLFHKNYKFASGVFFGLSLVIKLFPVFIIPVLCIRKQWKIVFSLLLTFLICGGIAALLVGFDTTIFFVKKILPSLIGSWKDYYYNQSISGVLARSFSDLWVKELLRIVFSAIACIVIALVVLTKRLNKNMHVSNLQISLGIITSLLINTFSWQHHFIWLIFPFFTLYFFMRQKKMPIYYFLLLFISYLLVSANISKPDFAPLIFQSHVFFGTVLLWLITIRFLLQKSI